MGLKEKVPKREYVLPAGSPTPMWRKELRPIDHKIVWLLLDIGAPGKVLKFGWQSEAARMLRIHRVTMARRVSVLIESGVLVNRKKCGEQMLNLSVFSRVADRSNYNLVAED